MISAATTSTQHIERTNLEGLRRLRVRSPATIVVGAVAAADVLALSELSASGALTQDLGGEDLAHRGAVPELSAPSALTAQGALP